MQTNVCGFFNYSFWKKLCASSDFISTQFIVDWGDNKIQQTDRIHIPFYPLFPLYALTLTSRCLYKTSTNETGSKFKPATVIPLGNSC